MPTLEILITILCVIAAIGGMVSNAFVLGSLSSDIKNKG